MTEHEMLAAWKRAVAEGHTIDGLDGWSAFELRCRASEDATRRRGTGTTWMHGIATTFDTQQCPDCGVGFHPGDECVVRRSNGWRTAIYHPDCARRSGW